MEECLCNICQLKSVIAQVLFVAGLNQVVFKLTWHKQVNLISPQSFYKKKKKQTLVSPF